LPAAPAADSQAQVLLQWNAVYDAYNEVACQILSSMTSELHRQFENSSPYVIIKDLKSMFEKQAGVERFDLIQTFHACKQEEVKPVAAYVLQMKGYVDQLECLGYMLPQDLRVGKDKQVYIPTPKNPKPSAKEHPAKDDICHHCKEGFREARKLKQGALYFYVGNGVRAQVEAIRSYDLVLPNGLVIFLDNCHYAPSITRGVVSVHRLVENGFVQCFIDFGISVSKNNVFYFNVIPSNGIYEIDVHDLVPNVNSIYNVSTKRAKHNLDSTYLWHYPLAHIRYPNETMGYYFYFPPENKIVVAKYAEFFKKNLITQEVSGRAMDLEEIQDEDTSPSEITSEIHGKVAEEHSLGDLNEPTSYKAVMLDSESNMWIDAMNAKIQSMIDNMVWVLVDLPPNCKTVETKSYTELYGVDYEKTFSPVADIRAIRILISIAAFYDYGIWQMDVKTALLNGYLDEFIYMVQPEGFVDPNHPRKDASFKDPFMVLQASIMNWNRKNLMKKSKSLVWIKILMSHVYIKRLVGVIVVIPHPCCDYDIIYGNHIPSLQSVKDYLGKCFSMKDLEEAAFILGIKIYKDRSKRLIGLGQNAYMDKILKRYKMDNSKRGHIPMQERLDLNKTQGASTLTSVKRMLNVPYASACSPSESHWTTVKNILKYLRNPNDMFLVYGGNPEAELRVDCYGDTGFETNIVDIKS
ncbi:retrotransposon protein, putative, ty1-copia subclass, partial [Tanacetum coccineum]